MNKEKLISPWSGWAMLALAIVLFFGSFGVLYFANSLVNPAPNAWMLFALVPLMILTAVFICFGFVILQPNEAAVLLLLGKYVGTVRREGFLWANPFYTKKKISLRMRNLNGGTLKVNDHAGNPIEIAAVVVWKIDDTYEAFFEVNDYLGFVQIQSESALRHLASSYPYDSWEENGGISLRANIDEVSNALEVELQTRLSKAGVAVLEARLSHLAYAPEIAEAMLRRQQASAVVAARTKIVEGAVGMVHLALQSLSERNIVELDADRKAVLVSNLLVVLCGESNAQPVLNTGSGSV